MSNFNYGDSVVMLNFLINGDRADCPAKYIELIVAGPKPGFHLLEFNTVQVRLEREKFMPLDEYFELYNSDKTKLPETAAKILWFQLPVEKEKRGNLLDKFIEDEK